MVISDAVHTEGDGLERSSDSRAASTSANLGASDVATGPARVAEQAQRREQPDEPMGSTPLPQTVAVEPHKNMVRNCRC